VPGGSVASMRASDAATSYGKRIRRSGLRISRMVIDDPRPYSG
jgi:hypothetical protein